MQAEPVVVFFYGSYINPAVLREVDLVPDRIEVARLAGFDIRIRPLANIVSCDRSCVYGVLATATHAELERLYAHARDVLGDQYLPRAVLAQTRDGRFEPALCYVSPSPERAAASADYVSRIVEPARAYRFPDWYLARLESYLP